MDGYGIWPFVKQKRENIPRFGNRESQSRGTNESNHHIDCLSFVEFVCPHITNLSSHPASREMSSRCAADRRTSAYLLYLGREGEGKGRMDGRKGGRRFITKMEDDGRTKTGRGREEGTIEGERISVFRGDGDG